MVSLAHIPDPRRPRKPYRPSLRAPAPRVESFARWFIAVLACLLLFVAPGCQLLLPEVAHIPQIQNPFPQLSRVAVAPFFNQSDEATVDGRRFALAYFAELQSIPGFEVVPLGVVEEAMIEHAIDLSDPGEARRLAQMIGVDAVVVGSVTDFSPYYPPRCGMRVEWYAANPGFHEIPPGYGLPWDTPEEEFIPPALVYEAEMAQARAQFAVETPDCAGGSDELPMVPVGDDIGPQLTAPPRKPRADERLPANQTDPNQQIDPFDDDPAEILPPPPADNPQSNASRSRRVAFRPADLTQPASGRSPMVAPTHGTAALGRIESIETSRQPGRQWDMNQACEPPASHAGRQPCWPQHGPVMVHTRIYHGHDPQLTEALAGYVRFRHDARFGEWPTYLQRSEEFIRFCCHMHISEMLTARGGAGETRVVCEWPVSR